jgi:hypothetical protein
MASHDILWKFELVLRPMLKGLLHGTDATYGVCIAGLATEEPEETS